MKYPTKKKVIERLLNDGVARYEIIEAFKIFELSDSVYPDIIPCLVARKFGVYMPKKLIMSKNPIIKYSSEKYPYPDNGYDKINIEDFKKPKQLRILKYVCRNIEVSKTRCRNCNEKLILINLNGYWTVLSDDKQNNFHQCETQTSLSDD